MNLPAREPPRWLPLALLLALVALLDPCWLDFEAARRAQLLVVVGVTAVLAPGWFSAQLPGGRWLLALLGWLFLAAVAAVSSLCVSAAVERLAHGIALLLLLGLGNHSGGAPWRRAAAPLLLLAAAAGILQRFGLLQALATVQETVSLFGNRNVAAEFVAIAAAAVAAGFAEQRRLGAVALLLGGAYLVVNGSRSALVALPAALCFAIAVGRGRAPRDRLGPLACALLGGVLGALLPAGVEVPTATPTAAAASAPPASLAAATVEVRLEIARSGLHMLADAPLLGHGPGQFAVQYPRFRSQREIELSSFGRAEMRRVGSAHDDWLELAIDGGVPALLLLLGYVVARWRAAVGDRIAITPLVALGLLMLVRAPLGNAPAVALALLASASTAPQPALAGSLHRAALRLLGLPLLALGLATLTAVTLLGRAVADTAAAGPEPAAVARAIAPWPYDPTAWQLLAAARRARAQNATDALAALDAAEHAVALRPHEPSYRLLRADLLRLSGRFTEAKRELAEVARLDPGEPQVNVQLAGVFFTEHDVDGTIAALCADPPPVLRRSLAVRFDEFAALATQQGDAAAARRFLAEASCVRALDATGACDSRARAISKERFETMRLAFDSAALHDSDLREYVVLALLALDAGDPGAAALAANAAARRERKLPAWQWSLLRPFAERLRAVTGWRALLPDD